MDHPTQWWLTRSCTWDSRSSIMLDILNNGAVEMAETCVASYGGLFDVL